MEIILGKMAGFCGGVIKSVKESTRILEEYGSTYCLGELVHNKQVVGSLEKKGLKVVNSLDEVPAGSRVIFRAHGVSKEVYEIGKRKNLEIVDLTCVKVLKIHDYAKDLVNKGYFIILVAQKDHPEAIGTISFCGNDCIIIEQIDEIDTVVEKVINSGIKKVALIAQTTYSMTKFDEISEKLKDSLKDYEFIVNKTICDATELRQKETEEISKSVDAMIIIGGSNSSNTKKLFEIASRNCQNSFIVETADQLSEDFSKYSKVGVMAGASTPQSSIEEVINRLNDNK